VVLLPTTLDSTANGGRGKTERGRGEPILLLTLGKDDARREIDGGGWR
jgi:hypothetical protein